MRNRIKDYQSSLFPTVPYHKLDIVYEDERTVNKVLEYVPYYKYNNPKKIVNCSESLIGGDKRYSILTQAVGRHGTFNQTILSVILIDNRKGTIERVIRSASYKDPNKVGYIEKRIKKALGEIIKDEKLSQHIYDNDRSFVYGKVAAYTIPKNSVL